MKDEYDYDDNGLNEDPTTTGGWITFYILQFFVGMSIIGSAFVFAFMILSLLDVI